MNYRRCLFFKEVNVLAAEVLVGAPEGGGLGAGQSKLGVLAHEAFLVEHGTGAAHEGEVVGDVDVVVDVRKTYVEDGAVVGLVSVVAVGKVAALEAGVDAAQHQRGVGGQLVEQRRGVTTLTEAGEGGGHAQHNGNKNDGLHLGEV